MEYKAHDYQRYASRFIEDNEISAILLDMGLGKTVITLSAINNLLFDLFLVKKVLVVAPLRVAIKTWPDEIKKWSHLKDLNFSVVAGDVKTRKNALLKKADIYIINRENVSWLVENYKFDFDMLVIDELSSFKNHKAVRFKALMKVRPKIKRICALTGTPSSNGLMDLFAEFKLLDMGKRLGRFIGEYRDRYFMPDKRNGQIIYSYKPHSFSEKEIYEKLSDITISMRAKDYLKMPDLVKVNREAILDKADREKYDLFKKDLVLSLKATEITAANAAVLSTKLLQMASGAIYDDDGKIVEIHDKKLDVLEDILESANGKPILIAYWFKHEMIRIKKRFDIREIKTEKDITDWNDKKIKIGLIHPASAGHGLNLQSGSNHLVWFSLPWSLELYQQTNARLYRQGQSRKSVVISHIIAKGTIDENVLLALDRKNITQNALIDALKANL